MHGNKAFDNLLASSNCMSFLWKLAACADLDFGGGGVGGVQTPPPPAPLQNWSSLNFHCKVNPGQTKKNRRTLPLDLGLFYYVYLRYLDFQTVGGGGESESPNPLPW